MANSDATNSQRGAILFIGFFLAGIIVIWLLKQSTWDSINIVLILLPAAILAFYAFLSKFLPGFKIRDDQNGDNCYYLGFLYTLVSLAATFYYYHQTGINDEERINSAIQSFGIAVSSTIVGVALRVFFHQIRIDPEEVENATRVELSKAARRVLKEMNATVMAFSSFRTTTQQQIAEGIEEVGKSTKESVKNTTDTIAEMLNDVSEPIKENSKILSQESKKITGIIQSLTDVMTEVQINLSQMKAPHEMIDEKLTPFTNEISNLANKLTESSELQTKNTEEILNNFKLINEYMGKIESNTVSNTQKTEDFSNTIIELVRSQSDAKVNEYEQIKNVADNLTTISKQIENQNIREIIEESMKVYLGYLNTHNQLQDELNKVLEKYIERKKTQKRKRSFLGRMFGAGEQKIE